MKVFKPPSRLIDIHLINHDIARSITARQTRVHRGKSVMHYADSDVLAQKFGYPWESIRFVSFRFLEHIK